MLFDVAPINLCPGDGDTVQDPPVSKEPQRTAEVPIITKHFFVIIIALHPAGHVTDDASPRGKTDFLSFGDESVDHLILETPGEDVVVALTMNDATDMQRPIAPRPGENLQTALGGKGRQTCQQHGYISQADVRPRLP